MPSQLVKNSAVYFMCARDFLWDGTEYKLGDTFDQEIAIGRIDLLVRTRRIIPVVDDIADKPRHWHHHVWLRKDLSKKLGLLNNSNVTTVTGSSLHNRVKQNGLEFASVETEKPNKYVDQDVAADLKAEAIANAATEAVLRDENADELDDGCVGEHSPSTNPDCDMAPLEPQNAPAPEVEHHHTEAVEDDDGNTVVGELYDDEDEDDDDEVTEEDLYDPSEHSVAEVMEYLSGDISENEFNRVVAVERTGKNRKGIVDNV